MMSRDDPALPIEIAVPEGLLERIAFEKQAHRCDLLKVAGRNRRDLEPALALGDDQRLGRKSVQQLPQGADAGSIRRADAVEPELLAGIEPAEDDVGPDAPVS